MNNYTVKKATIIEVDELSILFNEYRIFYKNDPDILGAKLFLLERINNKESEIFVVESNSRKIVGFLQMYPLFSSTRMQKLWLLNDLFVDFKYRGLGLSKLLIKKAQNHCLATNACSIILETEKENKIGNQLYLTTGFAKDILHNFYEWKAVL